MKRIVLTGGGTAGHVTPNIALIAKLRELDYDIHYIGSIDGIEKELVQKEGIPYYGIASGKLRRYHSWKNFSDPIRVLKGLTEAVRILKRLKPDVIFSKGGFVAVPVVIAARDLKIPTIIHESDMTPGLANKLCIPSAKKVCCNFEETLALLPASKAVLTGTPLRHELYEGDRAKGLEYCGFNDKKPVIMVVGGSTGAKAVNDAVRDLLPTLLLKYQVAHICGKGKTDPEFDGREGYRQFEYVSGELKHLFAASDIVVSRAGANAVSELLALKKPNLLIPLGANASRGDQILNAESFESRGYSMVLREQDITNSTLLDSINTLYEKRDTYIENMSKASQTDSVNIITKLIEEAAK